MNGKDCVARVRIFSREGVVLANPGESCERVSAESLSWLIEQGHIEAPDAPKRRKKESV